MRPIKFRGKTRNGDWVYGSFIHTNLDAPAIVWGDGEQVEVIPETVGQFTGLTGTNGKEIWEGESHKGELRWTLAQIQN